MKKYIFLASLFFTFTAQAQPGARSVRVLPITPKVLFGTIVAKGVQVVATTNYDDSTTTVRTTLFVQDTTVHGSFAQQITGQKVYNFGDFQSFPPTRQQVFGKVQDEYSIHITQ